MTTEIEAVEIAELNALVQRTARVMKARLHQKHAEGRRGWKQNIKGLFERFHRAESNRDYLDASILAAMIYDYQRRNAQRK